jgi:hypothetical protein
MMDNPSPQLMQLGWDDHSNLQPWTNVKGAMFMWEDSHLGDSRTCWLAVSGPRAY